MNHNNMEKVIEAFKTKNNFLITGHINPEGDSIGSQLAVHYMLKKMAKKTVLINHDNVPPGLKFLPGSEFVSQEAPKEFNADVAIILDCPVKERVGKVSSWLKGKELIINIDHHVSNESFGDINWVEPEASSVGEMVFYLAKRMNLDIDKDMAVCLYTAILTDTGMFNYENTRKATHEAAGELIELGVNPKLVHNKIFEARSLAEVRLLGKTLTTLRLELNGALAYMSLTRAMCQEEGVESVSTDEFINFPRSIKGVEVAVFFKEDKKQPKKINVSFRSGGRIDVNKLAGCFGGGGHTQASGCILECGLDEAQGKVLTEVKKALEM